MNQLARRAVLRYAARMDRNVPAVSLALGVRPDGVRGALLGCVTTRTRMVASLLGAPVSDVQWRTRELVGVGVPEADALDWVLLTAAR